MLPIIGPYRPYGGRYLRIILQLANAKLTSPVKNLVLKAKKRYKISKKIVYFLDITLLILCGGTLMLNHLGQPPGHAFHQGHPQDPQPPEDAAKRAL